MNKTVLLVLISILSFWNCNSQINRLSDFLAISELSMESLSETLQYDWRFSTPVEDIKDNIAKSRYTFSISYEEYKQVLQRTVLVNFDYDIKMNSTSLIFNDRNLLNRFKENLSYEGYKLKRTEGNQSLYKDGIHTIILKEGATEDDILSKGYYKIEILNYGDKFLQLMKNNATELSKIREVRYSETFQVLGKLEKDMGTFDIKGLDETNCEIQFKFKNKEYNSINCDDYKGFATLVSKQGDTIKITFGTPELNSAMIDIKGNDIRFDYESN